MKVKLRAPFWNNSVLFPPGVHEFPDSTERKALPSSAVILDVEPEVAEEELPLTGGKTAKLKL